MLNRALRQTYPPGSTFKLVTAAAALESGRYTPGQHRSTTPRELDLPQTTATLPNYNGGPCSPAATATLTVALENSCNVAFGAIGLDLGDDALREQADEVRLRRARSRCRCAASRATSRRTSTPPQTAQSAIGQFDVRATPLQMAMVAAAIANRGVRDGAVPRAGGARGRTSTVLDTTKPRDLGEAISPQTAVLAHHDDDDGRRGRHRHQRARSPASRWPARPAPPSRAAGAPRTRGSCPSRRPTPTRRSLSRSSSRTAADAAGDQRQRAGRTHRPGVMRAVLNEVTAPGTDQVLGGRYRLTERIAGGGMGEVWRAEDERARADRGREAAAPRVRRRLDVPRALPRRGAAHRGAVAPRHRDGLRLRRGH